MTARPHPRVTLADGRYAHERHVERARQPETPSVRFVDDVEPYSPRRDFARTTALLIGLGVAVILAIVALPDGPRPHASHGAASVSAVPVSVANAKGE